MFEVPVDCQTVDLRGSGCASYSLTLRCESVTVDAGSAFTTREIYTAVLNPAFLRLGHHFYRAGRSQMERPQRSETNDVDTDKR